MVLFNDPLRLVLKVFNLIMFGEATITCLSRLLHLWKRDAAIVVYIAVSRSLLQVLLLEVMAGLAGHLIWDV